MLRVQGSNATRSKVQGFKATILYFLFSIYYFSRFKVPIFYFLLTPFHDLLANQYPSALSPLDFFGNLYTQIFSFKFQIRHSPHRPIASRPLAPTISSGTTEQTHSSSSHIPGIRVLLYSVFFQAMQLLKL